MIRLGRITRLTARLPARSFATHFSKSHEYAKIEGATATFGITPHAASELGDIVFVDLPEVGDTVTKGESFGAVESVKAASDVYAPVSGVVAEINAKLGDEPNLVNESALEDGWFVKVTVDGAPDLGELMDQAAYDAFLAQN